MSKTESRIVFTQATDTEFRTWVTAVIADMTAIGLVQTSDTGQINTSTVLTPSAANQVRGFWMASLNDGITDIFIKVEFGSGSTGAACPAMFFTLGWATDGAGNFTGNTTSRLRYRYANANNGATAYMRMCKVGSCVTMMYNEERVGTSPNPWAIIIDRYRNATTGVANANGVLMIGLAGTEVNSSGAGAIFCTTIAFPISNTQVEYGGSGLIGPFLWSSNTTWSRGSRLGVGTIHAWDSGATQPTIGGGIMTNVDCPQATVISVSLYGSSFTFRSSDLTTIVVSGSVGALAYLYQ